MTNFPPCPPGVSAGKWGRILKMSRYLGIAPPPSDASPQTVYSWFDQHFEAYQEVRNQKSIHKKNDEEP